MSKPCDEWRIANTITDWEFSEIGMLLCDHTQRDLALMIVRLRGEIGAALENQRNTILTAIARAT